ncbi:hypothetical protein MCU_00216 [Bartonella elizabethae Re6043vi]|uniref:Lipoprotein n=1 Tax=Bartonella elizabethae Re6043vi TaxID=1094554 RepID=A0ABN0GN26_BAREL|nr:hypothetical protein [Bartonella elizabethae]EJF84638.1 hypothetical protein MCU_00216 [Bartonella elizabethae Re6043vi]
MKKILKLLSAIVLLNSSGCVSKPPPSTLALWEKLGVNKSVVQQALSKCGWKPIYASSENMDSRASEFAAIYECMTKAGYRYKLQDSKGIYFSSPPRSDSFLVNLMIAGYQQTMENDIFGVTNSTKQEQDLMLRIENDKKRQKIKKALKK